MNKSVFCISKSMGQTEKIVSDLQGAGFSADDISVLFPDKSTSKDFAHEKHTKAPEGAAVGGTVGISAGAALGWLAGIGSLSIPGIGPFIAAGPIMGALSGAGIGAAAGSLTGALVGMGIPEYEAKRYDGKIRGGSALISVHTENGKGVDKAKDVFEQCNAEDISYTEEETAHS